MQADVCLNISISVAFRVTQKNYLTLFESLGYGFMPAFTQARSKQKSDWVVQLHHLVFTSVLRLQHFHNIGQNTSELLLGSY